MSIESSSFKWKVRRIASMSVFEIIKRIIRTLEFKFFGIKLNFRIIDFFDSNLKPAPSKPGIEKNEYDTPIKNLLTEADHYLYHRWFYFGSESNHEKNIDWHYDYINNKTAPKKLSFSINHREFDEVGNIKVIWEKNRHHHLTVLSIAFYLTNDERYAQEVIKQIKDWVENNPFLVGVNWTHPLENAIRLISWVYCERFLRNSKYYNQLFNKENIFWKSVYEHQKFITKTYTVGSSANNHLIGEMAGLFVSSANWPFFPESSKWIKLSKRFLENEIEKQSFKSGVNKEMAFAYQIFVYEFYLISLIESRNHNYTFSQKYINLLINNARIINDLTNGLSIPPNYGDGDDGMAIQVQELKGNRIAWLMEVTNSIFPDLQLSVNEKTLPAALLGYPSKKSHDLKQETTGYTDAGIYILRNRIQYQDITCLFKAGSFGYKSIAAHGHADSLSFILYVNGIPIFIDPGTYCYHTDLEFRTYFRSTRAHNTLCINNTDQSEQLGPFLWGKKTKTRINTFSASENQIEAFHSGYQQFSIIHTRTISLKEKFMIIDEVAGKDEHLLDFRFHLHPEVKIVHADSDNVTLNKNNIELSIRNDQDFKLDILSASEDGGWYSPQFNVKVPTHTLSYQKKVYLPFKQTFSIEF